VVHKDVRLSEVRVLDIMNSDHLLIMFYILYPSKAREILDPVEKIHRLGAVSKPRLCLSILESRN
jgi:hypothetical protein